jgi:hypothetical protein
MVRKLGWAFVVAILLALVDWQPKVVVETVEVEKVVIETVVVEVEKVVIETVIVEKEVEVEKTIIETVIEAKEVIIKTVIVEVEVEVEVTPTPLVPVTMFSTPGTFRVGVEIEPGVYKVVGEGDIPDCYWARLKCFDGTTVCLVLDKVVRGFGYVEVKATDLALETYAVNSGASCTFTLQN